MGNEAAKKGMLIAFDGIDGSGKTTNSNLLGAFLKDQGWEVVHSKEPTDGPWGTKLRNSGSTGRLSLDEELQLFMKDRLEHVQEVINPSLSLGKAVILDRYYFSTMAYQGARGLDPVSIREQNEAFAPIPDHLFVLDLDVDLALGRIGARGDVANEFERRENLEACRDIFLSLKDEPFVHVIDTSGSLEEVQEKIRSCIR